MFLREKTLGGFVVKKILRFILSIIIITIFVYSLYAFFSYVRAIFSDLPKEVLAPIIAGLFTVIVSLITVYLSKYLERKSTIEQEQRPKKVEIYLELIHSILSLMPTQDNRQKPMSQDEIIVFIKKFTETVIIYGSNDVILAWSNWRNKLIIADPNKSFELLLELENVIFAIRKDLGHKKGKFKQKDVLRMFINDIDSAIPTSK